LLDAALARLPSSLTLLCRVVFDALITREKTERAMRVVDLLEMPFIANRDEVQSIMNAISAEGLVRSDRRGSDVWYEIIHERLVEDVEAWIRRDRDYLAFAAGRDIIETGLRTSIWQVNFNGLLTLGQVDSVVGPYKERLRTSKLGTQFLLLSSIYRGSDTAAFWLARYGRSEGLALLGDLLTQPDAEMRKGVCWFLRSLDEIPNDLRARCLQMAFEDPDGGVRRSAGQALAEHAGAEEISSLKQALNDRSQGAAVNEILADFIAAGRDLPWVGTVRRFGARRIVRRRLFANSLALRTGRAYSGALIGAVSGAVWTCTVGLALVAIQIFLYELANTFIENLAIFPLFVVIGLIAGAALGFGLGGSSARRDVLGKPLSWPADALGTPLLWALPTFFTFTMGTLLFSSYPISVTVGVLLQIPVVWAIGIILILWISQSFAGRRVGIWRTVMLGFFLGPAIIPTLFIATITLIHRAILPYRVEVSLAYAIAMSLFIPFCCGGCVATCVLVLVRRYYPHTAEDLRSDRNAR
jgi:hypothetical protein